MRAGMHEGGAGEALYALKVGDRVEFHHGLTFNPEDDLRTITAATEATLTIEGGREFQRSSGYAVNGSIVYITPVRGAR